MGDTAAETLSEIDATRERLGSDIDALVARLPDRDEVTEQAKTYGGAAAGAGAGLGLVVLLLKRRSARKERERHARDTARFLLETLEMMPEEAADEVAPRASRTGPVALIAALIGLAVSVANGLSQRSD